MCCGKSAGPGGTIAYKVMFTKADTTTGLTYALDLGAVRMARTAIEGDGGTVTATIAVGRGEYDAWAAQQP